MIIYFIPAEPKFPPNTHTRDVDTRYSLRTHAHTPDLATHSHIMRRRNRFVVIYTRNSLFLNSIQTNQQPLHVSKLGMH